MELRAVKDWTDYEDAPLLQVKEVGDTGHFSGYGSVFGNVDRQNEVCEQGCFKRSLDRNHGKGFPLLWCHCPEEPIGIVTSATEDDHGLKIEGDLILEVRRAAEAHALVKRGAVSGFSIGYRVRKDLWERDTGVRRLKEVELSELSLVPFPANEKARVRTMKSDGGLRLPLAADEVEFDPDAAEARVASLLEKSEDSVLLRKAVRIGDDLVADVVDGRLVAVPSAVVAVAAKLWGMGCDPERSEELRARAGDYLKMAKIREPWSVWPTFSEFKNECRRLAHSRALNLADLLSLDGEKANQSDDHDDVASAFAALLVEDGPSPDGDDALRRAFDWC